MSLIALNNIYKIYNVGGEEVRALDGIDLKIEENEYLAIMGPSGSGKSTLMNMVGCLDTPSSGVYQFEGEIRKAKRIKMSAKALEDVGLKDRMYHKPNELSGGQRQRVAIARALVNKPSIILADEPTGNLDSKSGNEIMSILNQLHQQGNTIILVTHEDDIAQNANRIIRLYDGKIVEDLYTKKN